METEVSMTTEMESDSINPEIKDYDYDNQREQVEETAVIKEPKIEIQSLYCYSCHQHFESLALFKSHHHHGKEEEKENDCCLDLDLNGISVTCHKCNSHFLSLRLFLDHLYNKTKKKKKLLDNSDFNSDSFTCNNSNGKNVMETEDQHIDNNSSVSFGDSDGINENEKDPEFDPFDVDEDFNLNPVGEEEEDEVNEENYIEEEDNDDDDDDEEFSPTKSTSKLTKRPYKKNRSISKKTTNNKKAQSTKKKVACGSCGKDENGQWKIIYGYKYILYRHIRKVHDPTFAPSRKLKSPFMVFVEDSEIKNLKPKIEQSQMDQVKKEESSDNKSSPKPTKKRVPNESLISCPICGITCRKYYLHSHMRNSHTTATVTIGRKRGKTKDDDDDDAVERNSEEEREFKREQKRRSRKYLKVKCEEEDCGKFFSCVQALKHHKVVHLKRAEQPIPTEEACPYCGKVFPLQCNLRQHIKRMHHEVQKPILCDQCPMTFPRQRYLTEHMRVHTGERPYLCTKCPLSFSYTSGLNRHLLTHEEKTLTCDFEGCGQKFRMKSTLKRHKQKHTGARPYKCKFPSCGYSAMDNKPLKTHYANAHPDFSYSRVQHENHVEPVSNLTCTDAIPNPPPSPPQFVPNQNSDPIPVLEPGN